MLVCKCGIDLLTDVNKAFATNDACLLVLDCLLFNQIKLLPVPEPYIII
jgi:hypothetical protein